MRQINTLSKWVRDLKNLGLAKSFYNLGIKCNKADDSRAHKWYLRSAKLGCVSAQSQVGTDLLFGFGVNQDAEESTRWLLRAAEQGCENACFRMAQYHYEFKSDPVRGMWWYQKSADMHYPPALMMVGEFNEFGIGTEINFEVAKMYYELALNCNFEGTSNMANVDGRVLILVDYLERTKEALHRITYNIEWGRKNNRTDAQVVAVMSEYFEEKSRQGDYQQPALTDTAGRAVDVQTYLNNEKKANNTHGPTIH